MQKYALWCFNDTKRNMDVKKKFVVYVGYRYVHCLIMYLFFFNELFLNAVQVNDFF